MNTYLYNLQAGRELEGLEVPFSQRNREERLLQYLPALFSLPEDRILVDEIPGEEYVFHLKKSGFTPGHFELIPSHPRKLNHLELWCFSPSGTQFLEEGSFPSWEAVKAASSKVEALSLWESPFGVKIESKEALGATLTDLKTPCLLKSEYGFSARGNIAIDSKTKERALPLVIQELSKGRRFVLEPLLKRVMDFSTQWILRKDSAPEFIGSTFCINDHNGRYLSSVALPVLHPFQQCSAFKEHLKVAIPALCKLRDRGYFGSVGIDAFLYLDSSSSPSLHPLVEINARKTMGSIAVAMQRRFHPDELFQIEFKKEEKMGLLPKMATPFNLFASVLESLPADIQMAFSTFATLEKATAESKK